jgi:FkbM family methyltransferase
MNFPRHKIISRIKKAAKKLSGTRNSVSKISPQSFEEQLYISLIEVGDVCFDVGANVGNVSVLLSRLSGKDGKVISFEPLWPMYVELAKRIRALGFADAPVITVPYGLAESNRVATIQVPGNIFGMGSLAKGAAWASALDRINFDGSSSDLSPTNTPSWTRALRSAKIVSYECSFVRLDSFCEIISEQTPDFIKIDVEGAELFVLQGGSKIFENGIRPFMFIELFAPWQRAFNYGPWDVLGYLDSLGYSIFYMCPNILIEYKPTKNEPFPREYENGYNIIALHPSVHANRMDRVRRYCSYHSSSNILPMSPPPMKNVLD